LRFLLANVSDFDPAKDTVADADLLEIDRFALSRAAELQADILAHFNVYEFHPVVSKLQVYCSEDLGAFYLDVLKDRLYTSAPKSMARRSAQTVLYRITHAMLRLMAPFLSFTAEEAWQAFGASESIFMETYSDLGTPNEALLAKWSRIREIRDQVNKDIEVLRANGQVGASLQAAVTLQTTPEDHALLASLGGDLKFVFITSQLILEAGESLVANVSVSQDSKCDRCWHYAPDVGVNSAHPSLCGRCDSNLHGSGEHRLFA
jgi:isoleucyl-tRNA synthetase